MAAAISSTVAGFPQRATWVGFSLEWTSLTRVSVGWSGIAEAYGEPIRPGTATQPVTGKAAAAAAEAFKNSRRLTAIDSPPAWNAARGRKSARKPIRSG